MLSRWAVDAEEVAGVEIVFLCAVPNVSAELASWALRSRESLGRTPSRSGRSVAGSGWEAAAAGSAVEGRGSVILQRQVLQSCFDPGFLLQLQFFDRVTVYEMACFLRFPLLCTETGTHSAFFLAGFGVLQDIDRVVDVLGTRLLCGSLWKNFTFFYVRTLFAWNLDLISLSPLFWQPLAPVRCDSPRKLLDEFRLFST